MTRPVARNFSPILAAPMKLSFRSKLIARITPGFSVLTERPIAESARVLIIPPCTNPEWLAMSSVGVISTTAIPSPVSATVRPSQVHAREGAPVSLLTALPLWHRHARRPGPRHQTAPLVQDISLAEKKGLFHLDHTTHRSETAFDHRADEVDLQLDGRVPHSIFLKRRQRHPHRGICDLRDDPTLHHATAVAMLRTGLQLEDHATRLSFCNPSPKGLHPPIG